MWFKKTTLILKIITSKSCHFILISKLKFYVKNYIWSTNIHVKLNTQTYKLLIG